MRPSRTCWSGWRWDIANAMMRGAKSATTRSSPEEEKTMLKTAKNALLHLCRQIALIRERESWTLQYRPINDLIRRHDRILARWPDAYSA